MRIFSNDIALLVLVYSNEKGTINLARSQLFMYPRDNQKREKFQCFFLNLQHILILYLNISALDTITLSL